MPKMKSHRGLAKRVKQTGSGKLKEVTLILLTVSMGKHRNRNVI